MRRVLTLFACSVILWATVTQLNHSVSGLRIYLFAGALFVTFAALMQPLATGLIGSMLAGLVFDANTPVAFGTHLLLFSAAHLLIFRVRERVPRSDTVTRVAIAVLANLALFLVFSFIQLVRTPAVSNAWPRLLVDLLCSQMLVALIAPWYFALQARALVLARAEEPHFA